MKHPALNNYFSVRCVQTIGELWGILHKDKSVFVRSWNRVHPCKFFLNNDLHFTLKRLEEMIENREFYKVVRKDSQNEIQRLGYQIMEVNHSMPSLEEGIMAMWELMGVPAKYFFSNTNSTHQSRMRESYKDIAKQIPQSIDWVCNWFESGRTLFELSLMYKLEL